MSENVPNVTVLIAARPEQVEVKAVAASRLLGYPADKVEIILARGKQPSAQRNAGIKAATGELIYFLDDDSLAPPENLRRGTLHFQDPEVQMVGGPNICPLEAPFLEQIFARVLSSKLAFGPSRARYTPVGQVRNTSEKELILCNLLARRQALLSLGGFNEALYPNEENALMDELQKRGGKLIYDPDFLVYRRPRSNLKSFAKMLMTYGRGRAEQFRLHPTFGSVLNFVPPLFVAYLIVASIAAPLSRAWIASLILAPLGVYTLLVLIEALALAFRSLPRSGTKVPSSDPLIGLASAPLIVLTHLLYGFGFWRGLFTTLHQSQESRSTAVVLEKISK